MILPATNGASKDVTDLYGDAFTVALAQAMTRLECLPYWHPGENAPARLVRAGELVRLSRVQLHDARTATVHGASRAYDLTGYHCTCPASARGQSLWCVHSVAVKLARTLALQGRTEPLPGSAPLDDTPGPFHNNVDARREAGAAALGTGDPVDDAPRPLPGAPTTAPARLAQATATAMDAVHRALETDRMPTEDRMTEDAVSYIPAPAHVAPAVADPPREERESTDSPRPLPAPPLLPSLDARTLEQSMQAWSAQRQVVKRFLQQELVEGTDYYTLRIKGRETKPALSKAGSEKFMALFQLHAVFEQDTATWTMLGSPQGTLCYRCQLHTRSGEMVGEGRGARTIQQDGGDINKAVKMVCKSSMVDAILRTGALSDVFTQDEPETAQAPTPQAPPARPTSQALRQRIWAQVQAMAPEVTTREACEAWVLKATGYALHPDAYADILAALEVR